MARIGVIGLGNWGTALAKVWCEDGHNVLGWTIEQEVYETLMTNSVNEKYLDGYEIPELQVTMELSDVIETCEILVLSLPSGVILEVVDRIVPSLRQEEEPETHQAPTEEIRTTRHQEEVEAEEEEDEIPW